MPLSVPHCPRCRAPLPESVSNEDVGCCPHHEGPSPGARGTPARRPTRPRKGSATRSALVAVAAIAAISVAGVAIYRNVAAELSLAFPARVVASSENPSGPGSSDADSWIEQGCTVRSRLVVIRAGKSDDDRPVVLLARPTGGAAEPAMAMQTDQGILRREIVRQAVLIAARDELGLATRDELLDDSPPVGQGSASAEVAELFPFRRAGWVAITRKGGGEGQLAAETRVPPGLAPR
jgi:hypothetical protein